MEFKHLNPRLRQALKEDGAFNDVTTQLLNKKSKQLISAEITAKAPGIFCGGFVLKPVFQMLTRSTSVRLLKKEGAAIKSGDVVAKIKAPLATVLTGERLALNLMCHLSGVASLTQKFVHAIKGTGAMVVDTRKTTPLWRDLEKFAVVCGGGHNHRFALDDAVLLKDNHIRLLARRGEAISDVLKKRLKGKKVQFIAMEAENYAEVWDAIKAKVDIILLDNMDLQQLKGAVTFIKAARLAAQSAAPLIEASGGINLSNIRNVAEVGVDRISIGAITHSAPALDFSLEVL